VLCTAVALKVGLDEDSYILFRIFSSVSCSTSLDCIATLLYIRNTTKAHDELLCIEKLMSSTHVLADMQK
jgi:hypothetical protein